MAFDLQGLDRRSVQVPDTAVAELRQRVSGSVLVPGDPGYDEARTLWNAMIDRRPALVVRARNAADVAAAMDFARTHDLLLGVRSGGHQIAGLAVADGALLVDLSQMRAVAVDPDKRTVRVEPGATLGEVDAATQPYGLAVPMGINSTTGIAGLTLGGGFGWISRKYGMTIDNLRAAEVVTADGKTVRASADEHPDLFWALRGGGGNFGIVTAFEFDLHPVGPEVVAGLIVHPFEEAQKLLPEFHRLAKAAPDGLTIWAVMRKAPPLPFLPDEWHGREVLIFAVCYIEPDGGRRPGAGGAARPRQADRRCDRPDAFRRLAAGLRPVADARDAQLLEEPRCRGDRRRDDRRPRPGDPHAAGPAVRDLFRHDGRSGS